MSIRIRRFAWLTTVLVGTLLSACAKTQQVPIQQQGMCGLLGPQCSQLVAGMPDQFQLRYVNPSAQWTSYSKVLMDPVTFWGPAASTLSPSDQQSLADYFDSEIRKEFVLHFQVVDKAGPGVMQLQVALTDVSGVTPGLRTIALGGSAGPCAQHGQVRRDRHLCFRRVRAGRGEDHRLAEWPGARGSGGSACRGWIARSGRAVAVGRRPERDE